MRVHPNIGMGQFRYYMVPAGLIAKDEVPAGWGLLWVRCEHVQVIKEAPNHPPMERNALDEIAFLCSMLRRCHVRLSSSSQYEHVADPLNQWLKLENRFKGIEENRHA